MKVYSLLEIAKDVRVALDMNTEDIPLLSVGDDDTLSLDAIIKSKVEEAVKRIHSEAPAYLLDGGNNFGDAVYWKDDTCGWVLLPEKFMRLVAFKMSDWERTVYSAITTDEPEYAKQSSRFKGLRGTPQKPVCAIGIRPEGRVLEFFSCKSREACVSSAIYIPYPEIDRYEHIEICERCYNAVVYMTASLTLAAMGETERGQLFTELAKSALL